ncbi:hypothetical protein JJC03_01220 [Flavobacterium oreochromis]|uniref:hypothetical protein n=1 Tax=Flavobacterium oreochromis TaxID=2906078 RepID=UPI001CE65044|nr:hypothetical protein [Flavobacterium oreochromis]QYS86711.1 hypothetical protein JJC03_01220 [Flavobacterium oreochromis]
MKRVIYVSIFVLLTGFSKKKQMFLFAEVKGQKNITMEKIAEVLMLVNMRL